jgi:cytochrome c5
MIRLVLICIALLPATVAQSYAKPQPHPSTTPSAQSSGKDNSAKGTATHPEEGERVFKQQCSRCHTAPDSFSPRISGTILRHMRVRASLSQSDEQKLLRFMNP